MTIAHLRRAGATLVVAALVLAGGCAEPPRPRTPAEVRAEIVRLLPAGTSDRKGWAEDIQTAFAALKIEPSTQNLCATLAVTEQESTFHPDPAVPGLGKIALAEIYRRAQQYHIPKFVIGGALAFDSADGKSYQDRLAAARTEQELSRIFEEFIDSLPMGKRLLASANPVHTGGPMQVSIGFAQNHAKAFPYPFVLADGETIRHEVFSRRGGMYFGIAHLLGYPTSYPKPLYRFADYNAGFYASRNAAFQQAVSLASGIAIPLDGDLVRYKAAKDGSKVGATEVAVQSLSGLLELSDAQIHRALEKGEIAQFERTRVYQRVFELAERLQQRQLPRAILPNIKLSSPKITRKLTTEWFAKRVDQRYQRCLVKAGRAD